MQRNFTLFFLFFISTTISYAQSVVSGKVMLANTPQKALSDINVYLEHTPYGTATNSLGAFHLEKIPAGAYTLVASATGFQTIKEPITVASDEAVQLNLTMEEKIMDLPEVVIEHVSMTGGRQGVNEIPGAVHYISPQELARFQYTDINRILRMVPGVNLQEEDGFGLRPNIGFRGTGVERSSKITIMEDGILMAPAPYAAPAAYYFPTVGRMQAVEIMKGASQIKYGPYTTGGAINFISTQIPQELSGNIRLSAGSFGSRLLHANVGDSYENVGFLAETFQTSADGFKELDNGGDTGFRKEDYLLKFRLNTNRDARIYQSLTFKIVQTQETSNETYLGLTRADFETTPLRRYAGSQQDLMRTEQRQLQLRHAIELTPHLDLTTSVYRNDFDRNWYKLDKVKPGEEADAVSISNLLENPSQHPEAYAIITGATSPNADALGVKNNNRSYYAQGVQSVLGYDFVTGSVAHEVEAGIRVHRDAMDRFQWVDQYAMSNGIMQLTERGTPGTESNRVETAHATAAYMQYKLILGKLTAVPGLRYESIRITREDYGKEDPDRTGVNLKERSNQVDMWVPGIGLNYEFNPGLSSFVGVHKGFSPPGSQVGARSEESVNYEAGVRYQQPALSGRVTFFFNDYQNLLGSDLAAAGGAGSTQQFNGGEVDARGVEAELQYEFIQDPTAQFSLPLSLAYTYTDATFQNSFESEFEPWGPVATGDHLPYLAQHQLALLLSLQSAKFDINISGKYISGMRTQAGQEALTTANSIDGYWVADVSAHYAISRNIKLFSSLTNAFNETYAVAARPAGLRPGMPRALTVGIRGNFGGE